MDHLCSSRRCRLGDGMTCHGICERFKATGTFYGGRYNNGQKRCQVCYIFIVFSGIWCPCCGYKLRSKPRNKKYKSQFRADTGAD